MDLSAKKVKKVWFSFSSAGMASTVGSMSSLAFGSLQVQFLDPTYFFLSCLLLGKRRVLVNR